MRCGTNGDTERARTHTVCVHRNFFVLTHHTLDFNTSEKYTKQSIAIQKLIAFDYDTLATIVVID